MAMARPRSVVNYSILSPSSMDFLEAESASITASQTDVLTCAGVGPYTDTEVEGFRWYYASAGPNPTQTHNEITVFRRQPMLWERYYAPQAQAPLLCPYILALSKKQPSDPYTTSLHVYASYQHRNSVTEEVKGLVDVAVNLSEDRGGPLIVCGDLNCRNIRWTRQEDGSMAPVVHEWSHAYSMVIFSGQP